MKFLDKLKEKFYRKLGKKNLSYGNADKALKCFKKAVIYESSTDNLFNLGLSLMALEKYEAALEYFHKVYENYPENELNNLSMAQCYMMLHEWDKATEFYKIVSDNNPNNRAFKKYLELSEDVVVREKYVNAKKLLGKAKRELENKNDDKALKYLHEANEYLPDNPMILNNIATILYMKNKYKQAYKYIEKAISIDPQNPKLQKSLSRIKKHIKK